MENVSGDKPKPFAFALQYGLYLGGILIALDYIFYAMNISMESKIRYLSLLILLTGVLYLAKNYRDKLSGGFLSYKNSFVLIFLLCVVTYFLQSLNMYVMLKFFDSSVVEEAIRQAENKLLTRNPNASDQELDLIASTLGPGLMTFLAFFVQVLFSVVISLLGAFFIKKNNPAKLIV